MKQTFWRGTGVALIGAGILAGLALECRAADAMSLKGEWGFALDRQDAGLREGWFLRELAGKIHLPGVLQAQNYGDPISVSTPWVLSLYDRRWFLRSDYQAYTNAGNVKVPFVCQPPRHYVGAAWYQHDVEIPSAWKDRRVVLFLERPHWESRVWLDGRPVGTNNSLCAPHEFELMRRAKRIVCAHRPSVEPHARFPVRAFEEQHHATILPRRWNLDVVLIPRSADVMSRRLADERHLHVAGVGVGLVIRAQKPSAIVQRQHPRRADADRVAVILCLQHSRQMDFPGEFAEEPAFAQSRVLAIEREAPFALERHCVGR